MIHIDNKHNLKVWHFSDTHGHHKGLNVPFDIDIAICSGDATNYYDLARNMVEWGNFIEWYANVPVPIKIYVPGNHDATCYHHEKMCREMCKTEGIEYLNKDMFSVYGLNFWGDPTTPTFGAWYFTADRAKTHKHWNLIPEDTDVLITHGPRWGYLDVSTTGGLHLCGDKALGTRIDNLPNLKLHCFGHIHDSSDATNAGVFKRNGVYYSNAAAVKDKQFDKGIHFHGNTFQL